MTDRLMLDKPTIICASQALLSINDHTELHMYSL